MGKDRITITIFNTIKYPIPLLVSGIIMNNKFIKPNTVALERSYLNTLNLNIKKNKCFIK